MLIRKLLIAAFVIAFATVNVPTAQTAEPTALTELESVYRQKLRPVLVTFCLECHSTEKNEGELDLQRFESLADLRKDPRVWQKVIEMLDSGEMPPADAKQPTPQQRTQLRDWARSYLDAEARANAGDPGRVVLRRLSNVEYDLTVHDLTGVPLQPAREFPGDGAAGEGFTNSGEALVMSPALIQKYFDAAKGIADHAVLLPDGIRFTNTTARRDWTNELLDEIRHLYRQHTDPSGSRRVSLQGLNFEAESGGRIPLEAYLLATIKFRDTAPDRREALAEIATERHLSQKYLQTLWDVFSAQDSSPLFNMLRTRWRAAKPETVGNLAEEIRQWQNALTKFNSVAHFKTWQEDVNPIVDARTFTIRVPSTATDEPVIVRLVARDAADGSEHDFVEWRRPRLESPNRPPVLLRDLRPAMIALSAKRATFQQAADYLDAVDEIAASTTERDPTVLANERKLDPAMLQAWLRFLGVRSATAKIETLFTERLEKSGDYTFVKGWGSPATPSIVANSSDQQVRIPGIVKPHRVVVHPAPKRSVAVGWQSPARGNVRIEPSVIHAHPECGNGVAWFVQWRRGGERRNLGNGEIERGKAAKIDPIEVAVREGDFVSLLIGPEAGDHTCDLTEIDLKIKELSGDAREWVLARDISGDILAGNPHADSLGNPSVWHFYHEPIDITVALANTPRGSVLDAWRDKTTRSDRAIVSQQIQKLLVSGPPADKAHPDALLHAQLTSPNGPLLGTLDLSRLAADINERPAIKDPANESSIAAFGLPAEQFGKNSQGTAIDAANLVTRAPAILEFRLPPDLAAGREFVVEAALDPQAGGRGSVQADVLINQVPAGLDLAAGQPVIAQDPIIRTQLENSFGEFRRVLPAAVCYSKIVPVDEVVTLVQFHRDDEGLSRLMLDHEEQVRLEQLWNELRFVSQDALKVQEAYSQFMEYVTQDGDVRVFEPLRQPIANRAAAFRQQLVNSESRHVDAVCDLAARAYRRPLTAVENQGLRDLYSNLRANGIEHDPALRLVLARVLVSPAFLYRVEQPVEGDKAQPVSNWELASRLSYFLWSSMPDAELLRVAASGKLHDQETLVKQTQRLMQSTKVRALATEFACQWLDVRGFDQLDEKNEQLFPEFGELRGAMYEETVRFFVDLFQHDRSILNILDADYAILNPAMAKHYQIPFPTDGAHDSWRRIEGLKGQGRGGILGMAVTLAKHSGASRTSPVLRGNWVSEFLLGEKLPKPPKNVPQLPETENATELTVRQLVEKHRAVASCAKCHDRIDALGFALERFDTIGRARDKDSAGRPIDTAVSLADGTTFDGLEGLRRYLLTQRRDQFVRQFCRKLLGYSLGRSVQLSDEPLLDEMMRRLAASNYRFGAAVEAIVLSQQFRYQRGRDTISEE